MSEIEFNKRFLNVPQAAEYLNVSVQTLNNFRHQKRGPSYTRFGRKILYDIQILDQFMDANCVSMEDGWS